MTLTDKQTITENTDQKAREVSSFFYSSDFWDNHKKNGKPIGLNGYSQQLTRVMRHESKSNIIFYFHVAHTQEYITIYEGEDTKALLLKEGSKMQEFISKDQLQNDSSNDNIIAEN